MAVPSMDRLYVLAVVAAPAPMEPKAAVSAAVVAALAVRPCRPAPLMAAAFAKAEVAPCSVVEPTKLAVGPMVAVEVPLLTVAVASGDRATLETAVPVSVEN